MSQDEGVVQSGSQMISTERPPIIEQIKAERVALYQ